VPGLPQKRLRTIILAWKKELNKVFLPTATHLFGKISLIEAISDEAQQYFLHLTTGQFLCLAETAKNFEAYNYEVRNEETDV
jgi:site-specific DNA-cytosine methylase